MTMFINAFMPIAEIASAVVVWVKRLWDRSFGGSFEKKGTDEINTKKVLQSDVEKLYIGPEIKAYVVYAKYFTAFWGIMVFSAGLPFLYFIGFATYFIQYWVFKFLLLKFFKKTVSFDDELPKFSIFYFQIGIVLHIMFAGFIFANSSLIPSSWKGLEEMPMGENTYKQALERNAVLFVYSEGLGILYFTLIILILVVSAIRAFLGKWLMIIFRWFLKKCLKARYEKIARFVEPDPEPEF